jgi:hypothetical protein
MHRWLVVATAVLVSGFAFRIAAQPAKSGDGQQIFRFDTFGDEQLWTTTLKMPEALATVSPKTALSVGLKVDAEALPPAVVEGLKAGKVDLNDPAVTLQLLSANAVVGVVGRVAGGKLDSVGVTCALCHSTVDNSLTAGVGKRLDGWPNRDLNVGAIVALSPVLTAEQRAVFKSWGPGKYDPRLHAFDGATLRPLNKTSLPVVIPPAYGLQQVPFETFTADGPISYWNNYVAVTQMGGRGNFSDPRINLTITQPQDLVAAKLPALLEYQLKLRAPEPPKGSFDAAAAQRGQVLFSGAARCGTCHSGSAFTDVAKDGSSKAPFLHEPSETRTDAAYANRTATKKYRAAPLAGVWQHPPYFHDGRAADLAAVVEHYNTALSLKLTAAQKADLVQYLKSL